MRKTNFRRVNVLLIALFISLLAAPFALAQTAGSELSQAEINRIVAAFTAKEAQFRQALTLVFLQTRRRYSEPRHGWPGDR